MEIFSQVGNSSLTVSPSSEVPKDAAIPVVGRYHAALKASSPDAQPGFVSLEGYLVGRAIIARANSSILRSGALRS